MKRLITIIMSLILMMSSLSLFACNNTGDNGGANVPSDKPQTDVTFKNTDIDVVVNGTSQYSIVIPENATYYVTFAANEFQNLFKMATGVTLNIVTENSAMTTEGYYFSLGDTVLRREAGTEPPRTGVENPLWILETDVPIDGEEGAFAVERKNNTLIMIGIDDYGTVFAAYEYMQKQFGYKFYAADEIYIENVLNEKLIDMNWKYTPYAMRNSLTDLMATPEASLRYFMIKRENHLWAPHSWLTVLPYETYRYSHPEFYGTTGGGALCLANEGMAKEYAKVILKAFDQYGYRSHMAGQPDDWTKCACNDCLTSDGKYGAAGTNVIFINRVCAEIDRLLLEQGRPDYKYRIMMLAYYQYETPPASYNQESGKWEPVDDKVKLHPNAGVQLCLFGGADAAYNLDDKKNEAGFGQVKGWLACEPNLFELYIYRGYFPQYNLWPAHDWATLKNWIVLSKEYQSAQNTWSIPAQSLFEPMRAWVTTQLAYDPTHNTNDLIEEFIQVYYKDAAPKVLQYFEEMTGYMAYMQTIHESFGLPTLTGSATHLTDKRYWPEEMLLDWVNIFEEAQQLIKNSEDLSQDMKDLLEIRLDNESVGPRYWLLKHYKTSYSDDEYAELSKQVLSDAYRAGYVPDGVKLP